MNHKFTFTEKLVKDFLKRLRNEYTEEELSTSATLEIFEDNPKLCARVLDYLNCNLKSKEKLVDLGCGRGILTILFKEFLNIKEAYGVDVDGNKLMIASRLLGSDRVFVVDLERDPLPFSDDSFDLIIMAGILNHLKFWDNVLKEARRILKPNGLVFISNPNLGWWVDRLSLLLGYQLSSVEVSEYYSVGLIPFYPRNRSIRYVHTLTLKGMKELLEIYGFKILKVWPVKITRRALNRVYNKFLKWNVGIIDKLFGTFPGLCVRTLLVANKFM